MHTAAALASTTFACQDQHPPQLVCLASRSSRLGMLGPQVFMSSTATCHAKLSTRLEVILLKDSPSWIQSGDYSRVLHGEASHS